jgi:penicillin-insensitive murein endopeptidase
MTMSRSLRRGTWPWRAILRGASTALVGPATAAALFGCTHVPSPTAPSLGGSIGLPHRGVLTQAAALPHEGEGFRLLRDNGRNYGVPRFVRVIERAAARVAETRPGPRLVVGDLSSATGGMILPHFSHRSGRDADLLFFVTTLGGAPVESPGFVHFDRDGLALDPDHHRFLRFDAEREWLLVKALVEDEEAHVQWIFASRVVTAILLEWARARGESPETLYRAMEVLAQPNPGGVHDDHIHVRIACDDEDIRRGCEPSGPTRPWFQPSPERAPVDDGELVMDLLRPTDVAQEPIAQR